MTATEDNRLFVCVRRMIVKVFANALLAFLGLFQKISKNDADLVSVVEAGFIHDCYVYGDLPLGYMRVSGGRVTVHYPRFCPYSPSMDTESTVLSDDSVDEGLGSESDTNEMSETSWIV